MSEWTIYSKSGAAKAVVHELEYHGEWMRDEYVTVTVKSAEPVDWQFDDYLTYRGEVFSISYDPNVVKKARRGTYGEGFTYDNIKFYAIGDKTRFFGFKDVVLNPQSAANKLTYTSLATFSFFCSSIEDFADRLQANLNRESQSSLVSSWKVLTPIYNRTTGRGVSITKSEWLQYFELNDNNEVKGETDVNIDVDRQNCFDVMKMSYEKFGLAYYMIGTTIVIGGKPVHLNTGSANIFRYGKGLGLYEIERTSDDNQELVTKLFAYGSEQNLPLNYYANIGKRVKFQITHKSVKTYISDHPTYYLWTDAEWTSQLKNAFPESGEVVLTFGSYSAHFRFDGSDTIFDDNEPTIELNKKCLYFYWIDYGEQEEEDLYTHVSVNDYVYVTGVNINAIPSSYIEPPVGYNYPATLSVNRLMLPGYPTQSLHSWVTANHSELLSKYDFSTTAMDPWIKSKNLPSMGLFEGIVNYDGSQQTEIFPSLENTTTNANKVAENTNITDNGYLGEGSDITMILKVVNGDLNWIDALGNSPDPQGVYVEIKSGFCAGRRFKVNKAKLVSNVWELTVERSKDDSTGRYFPYFEDAVSGYAQVKTNDTFVVTGIQMPDSYIEAAAEKLLIAACGYLDKRDHVRYTYLPKIDEIFMQRDHDERDTESYHDTIRAGMKLEFEDTDLGIWQSPFIDNLTIRENGNNGIPSYDVVLRDEKEKGTLEKLTDSIAELMANPPVQVVERQQRTLQYVEYPEWDDEGLYYFETVNPDTDVLETSRVWHRGCLWECHRTLTQQEPWFNNEDWVCLRMNNVNLGFYTDEDPPLPILMVGVRVGYVDETIVPYLLVGQEDISSTVTSWEWVRESGDDVTDDVWKNSKHTDPEDPESPLKSVTRTLHITDDDLPENWWVAGSKVSFKCTATFPYESGESAEIINSITII